MWGIIYIYIFITGFAFVSLIKRGSNFSCHRGLHLSFFSSARVLPVSEAARPEFRPRLIEDKMRQRNCAKTEDNFNLIRTNLGTN